MALTDKDGGRNATVNRARLCKPYTPNVASPDRICPGRSYKKGIMENEERKWMIAKRLGWLLIVLNAIDLALSVRKLVKVYRHESPDETLPVED